MAEPKLPKIRASEEADFSDAPIFKMYGPSPGLTRQPRWRNGATIPVREGQYGDGAVSKRCKNSRPSPLSPQDVAAPGLPAVAGNSDGDGQRDGMLEQRIPPEAAPSGPTLQRGATKKEAPVLGGPSQSTGRSHERGKLSTKRA